MKVNFIELLYIINKLVQFVRSELSLLLLQYLLIERLFYDFLNNFGTV